MWSRTAQVVEADAETRPIASPWGLDVQQVDEATGNGVFARREFSCGDLILREPPIVVCQMLDCLTEACKNCLRPLDGEEFCKVLCQGGCGHAYCSEACRESAALSYHMSMCSAKATEKTVNPLREFETFVATHSNEYYLLAAMAMSMSFGNLSTLKTSVDLDEFISERTKHLFDDFAQAPWWETMYPDGWNSGIVGQEEVAKAEHASAFRSSIQQQTNESLELLLQCYSIWPTGVKPSHRLQLLYANLVGLMRMNCASIKIPLHAHDSSEQGPTASSELSSAQGQWLSGMGLFATQARMNHACNANAALSASSDDAAASATVRALRPIRSGEQILLAYLDSALSPRLTN